MQVFKFGGASVKDAGAVKNVAKIVKEYIDGPLVIVVSAMGKSTNALEKLLQTYYDEGDYKSHVEELKDFHFEIADGLFENRDHDIYNELDSLFLNLECYFEREISESYDFIYDQVVSYGEVISSRIVNAYLNSVGIKNRWIDARNFIITDNTHREGRINWQLTETLINSKIKPLVQKMPIVTQGFIGSTPEHHTTTLGREGSDYTAAIFAFALHAEAAVIWKDVPGVLNADPKKFPNTTKFDKLSYEEAIEMTYYGATVIHPKTIKPLQNRNIPLKVKSFLNPEESGTLIAPGIPTDNSIPIIILKEQQVLISFSSRDFSFIAEEHLSMIFGMMAKAGVKLNVMKNSAISFSICTDHQMRKVQPLVDALSERFEVKLTPGLKLLTIRHYTIDKINEIYKEYKVVMEQSDYETIQFVIE